jgi:hypothetical protein
MMRVKIKNRPDEITVSWKNRITGKKFLLVQDPDGDVRLYKDNTDFDTNYITGSEIEKYIEALEIIAAKKPIKITKFKLWLLREFCIIENSYAKHLGLHWVKDLYGDQINHYGYRSLWADWKGREYRVKFLEGQ